MKTFLYLVIASIVSVAAIVALRYQSDLGVNTSSSLETSQVSNQEGRSLNTQSPLQAASGVNYLTQIIPENFHDSILQEQFQILRDIFLIISNLDNANSYKAEVVEQLIRLYIDEDINDAIRLHLAARFSGPDFDRNGLSDAALAMLEDYYSDIDALALSDIEIRLISKFELDGYRETLEEIILLGNQRLDIGQAIGSRYVGITSEHRNALLMKSTYDETTLNLLLDYLESREVGSLPLYFDELAGYHKGNEMVLGYLASYVFSDEEFVSRSDGYTEYIAWYALNAISKIRNDFPLQGQEINPPKSTQIEQIQLARDWLRRVLPAETIESLEPPIEDL